MVKKKKGDSGINKNVIFNTIKSAFSIIYPLIAFPYISRVLMTDNVGKVNFGSSVISYFSLIASLGVTTYAVRECSKVRDDREQLGKTAGEILSINLVSTAIAYLALIVVLIFAEPLENYRLLICIQSASILFTTLGADWLNTAMEDFKFIALRTVFMQIVSLFLMFIFVRKQEDYILFAIISVVASSGANIVNIFYRRKYCETRLTWKMGIRRHLAPILLLFSLILSQTIYTNSDMTILGLVKGDYQVGLYSTSVKIYNLVNTMVASIAWVVMPQLSAGFARKDYKEINRLLKYSMNFILVLGIPCVCGIEIIAPQLIHVIAGEAYVDAALSLRLLGIALMCSFISGWIGNMTMLPAGKEKICLWSSVVSAMVNIVLNLILIPKWGLNAAAFTTALSELIGVLVKLPYIDKQIKIDRLGEMLKAPIIGSIGILLLGFAFKRAVQIPWRVSALTILASAAWYLLVLAVTKNEFFMGFAAPVIDRLGRRK